MTHSKQQKDNQNMKPMNWQQACTNGMQMDSTTAAYAPNAATGATANAHKATGRFRTFCSATTACNFVARSRKYLLGELMA